MNLVIKKIYDLGARTFWIHNTGPIGCLSFILVNFPSVEKDHHGCAKPHNEVAKHFNQKLKEAVDQLRRDLPLATITYVDMYSVKYSLFSNPEKYGEPNKNGPLLDSFLRVKYSVITVNWDCSNCNKFVIYGHY